MKPVNKRPFLLQSWRSLLFLHWPAQADEIQARLPKGLRVDTYQGQAYLGIVPFYMHGLRPRYGPPCPGISYFPELNLRTYVRDQSGRPGVWFFSLDAHSRVSVWIARKFFNLPYHYAKMSYAVGNDGTVDLRSNRPDESLQQFTYKPGALIGAAAPGSLEAFLVERYRFFSVSPNGNELFMGELSHAPYELHEVALKHYSKALFSLNGFEYPADEPTHMLFSYGVEVEAQMVKRLEV